MAGGNVERRVGGSPLVEWTYKNKGTAIPIGERAVAHEVMYVPIATSGDFPAKTLEKVIAARWVPDVSHIRRVIETLPNK